MNLPVMLTMVEKVHAFTQEEMADIKNKLRLNSDPKFVSKFQLPMLSTDISYKNMANVLLNESFMLPNGEIVNIDPQFVLDGNFVKLVAPKGLDGFMIFAANKDGGYSKLYQGETLDPKELLKGGKAPEGAKIENKKLIWTEPFIGKGVLLANDMLDGYEIAEIPQTTDEYGRFSYEFDGDKIIVRCQSITIIDGSIGVFLVKSGSDPADGYDQFLTIEFKGRRALLPSECDDDDDTTGCNAAYPLLIAILLVPFMIARKK
jgi:hypothetical protein